MFKAIVGSTPLHGSRFGGALLHVCALQASPAPRSASPERPANGSDEGRSAHLVNESCFFLVTTGNCAFYKERHGCCSTDDRRKLLLFPNVIIGFLSICGTDNGAFFRFLFMQWQVFG